MSALAARSELTARRDPAALTGLLFGVVTVVGLFTTAFFAEGSYPLPDAPLADVRQFFQTNAGTAQAQAVWQVAASVLLVAFACTVSAAIRPFSATLAGVAQAGGVLSGGFFGLSAVLVGVLGSHQFSRAAEVVHPAHLFGFLAGGPAHVVWLGVLVGAMSLAGLRFGMLPRWLSISGLVSATLSLLSALAPMVWEATAFLPLGRFSGILVLAAASVILSRRQLR
ncbi:MAG: hypothetical protein GEU94_03040 [Micromonosporaceae bacterium]|nr:hypothetical protein [Micromonosporaceae bacterium]